jgi:ribosomal protein L14E/L6E/L27E
MTAPIAKSTAGRDCGTLYVVVGIDRGCVLLADGKHHKLSKPKRKNPKHILHLDTVFAERVTGTDAELRRILARLRDELQDECSGAG